MVGLWFFLVCAMFAAYVVLDGYDLGTGIVAPFVAKTDAERRAVLHSILPVWDGNEVFLVAGGATLYLAFPRLFPAFVSGFYLPVMIALWLLALRGISIEMRHKLDQPLWNELWDGGFFLSSGLLVVVFGAALGNLVRGVSVDEHGEFFAPLWTDLRVTETVGIVDWYTALVAATAVLTLARHGALRLAEQAEDDEVRARSRQLAARLVRAWALAALVTTVATFAVRPSVGEPLGDPLTWLFALLAAGGGIVSARQASARRAFGGSIASIVGLFGCACASVYPYGLVARIPSRSVLAADAAADPYALGAGLAWWIPSMLAVVGYTVFARRRLLQ